MTSRLANAFRKFDFQGCELCHFPLLFVSDSGPTSSELGCYGFWMDISMKGGSIGSKDSSNRMRAAGQRPRHQGQRPDRAA